jgi:hypothetical protein
MASLNGIWLIVAVAFCAAHCGAAIRVLRVEGDVRIASATALAQSADDFGRDVNYYVDAVMKQPQARSLGKPSVDPREHKPWRELSVRTAPGIGEFISVGTNSYVDLELVELPGLLRLTANTTIRIERDGHPPLMVPDTNQVGQLQTNGMGMFTIMMRPYGVVAMGVDTNRWKVELTLRAGRVIGISRSKSEFDRLDVWSRGTISHVLGDVEGMEFEISASPLGHATARTFAGVVKRSFFGDWTMFLVYPRSSRYAKMFIEPRSDDESKELRSIVDALKESEPKARAEPEEK